MVVNFGFLSNQPGAFTIYCTMDLKTMIYRYCNYQERCHKEVKNKLYDSGARTPEVNEMMAELIEAGLLNEERYARAFVRGKFRMKQWGRNKIVYELKQNQVSEYCIRRGLSEIDEEEYAETLQKLTAQKLKELSGEKNLFIRKGKIARYLQQKGFEHSLIQEQISRLNA